MKNKNFIISCIFLYLSLFLNQVIANDQFTFEIPEINITDNANLLLGKKRGTIFSNDGSIITSDNFEYNKKDNILNLSGNVIIDDKKNDVVIYTDKIKYLKNDEKIYTKGITKIIISSSYTINSKDVTYDNTNKLLSSSRKTTLNDVFENYYSSEIFEFSINEKLLKASEIFFFKKNPILNTISEQYFFKNGFFDLNNQNFKTKDVIIKLDKNSFGRSENDPRLYAVSAVKEGNLLELNKAIFTSCKQTDKCPPWTLSAQKIVHDKNKKQLIYDNAILKIYDIPVLYFPKFFHPDPTVERQSGFLKPFLNKSNIIGSSIQIPSFNVISENKDFTFKPTIFNKNLSMLQNEFRYQGKNLFSISDFAITNGYKSSSISNNKKKINHLFSEFSLNLNKENFAKSVINGKLQRTNNDTYLKVFNSNLSDTAILPNNPDILTSNLDLELSNEDYDFKSGLTIYENLQKNKNDRYQYILPYFNLSRELFEENEYGFIELNLIGENILQDTNNLRSKVTNNINYESYELISSSGFINKFSLNLKNLNVKAKNDVRFKSDTQIKLMGMASYNASLPLSREDEIYLNTLSPKISLRTSPGKIENYSDADTKINYNNIFDINRLALIDNFETGNSLTFGIDYKKEKLNNINKYFEFQIASVIRDKTEKNLPETTTLGNKQSNYFGSVGGNWDNFIKFNYDFSIDNNLKSIDYNEIRLNLNKNKFYSELSYLEENKNIGNENLIEGKLGYNINENNFLTFKSRRNKKINLTEFYDLIYEYKNDCLTAGIKYKKTFYSDRDLKPTQDLMFSITLFPLTTIEQNLGSKN